MVIASHSTNEACCIAVGTVKVSAAATKDPSKRIVITGMGVCSVFGNDVDGFYDS